MRVTSSIQIEGTKDVCLKLRQQILEMCSQYPNCTYSTSVIDGGEAVYEEKDVINLELEDSGFYAYKEMKFLELKAEPPEPEVEDKMEEGGEA